MRISSEQGLFPFGKQLVVDLPQRHLVDDAVADDGIPLGAGIQLRIAALRQHPLCFFQRNAQADADAQQAIP